MAPYAWRPTWLPLNDTRGIVGHCAFRRAAFSAVTHQDRTGLPLEAPGPLIPRLGPFRRNSWRISRSAHRVRPAARFCATWSSCENINAASYRGKCFLREQVQVAPRGCVICCVQACRPSRDWPDAPAHQCSGGGGSSREFCGGRSSQSPLEQEPGFGWH